MTRVTSQIGMCVTVLVLGVQAGCRTHAPIRVRPSSATAASALDARSRGPASLIRASEIDALRASTAYEAVRRLRPEFLARRVAAPPTDPYGGRPVVYVDGVRNGAVEMLHTIPGHAVLEIRFVSASAAFDTFGTYHPGGAIAVRTRR
jgi:hypothetical protein